MLSLNELRTISIHSKKGRVQREWESAWSAAEQRIPDDDQPLGMAWVYQYGRWNGVIPEGDLLWFGELLLTTARFVLISPTGIGQIPLRDVSSASHRTFRRSLFKKSQFLLLSSGAEISHVFSLPDDAATAQSYCALAQSAVGARPTEKFT